MKSASQIHRRASFLLIIFSTVVNCLSQDFSWIRQNSGTYQWLNDIYFTDPVNGWATGTNGIIIATADGGDQWTIQPSGTDQELRSVFFINPDTGWIAGGSSSPVLLGTTDGGDSWSPIEAVISGTTFLDKIQFADRLNGYAIDTTDVFRTVDGGLTWEKASYSPLISEIIALRDLHVVSENEAFVCGMYRNKLNQTLPGIFENLTLPDGQWLPQGAGELNAQDELTSIHFTRVRKGFTGSQQGRIYSMQQEGEIFPAPWTLQFEPLNGAVQSIVFSTILHGMFNVEMKNSGVSHQLIYHTADSGASWSTVPDTLYDFQRATLTSPDANHAWIAGSNGIIFRGERVDPVSATGSFSAEISVNPNPFSSWIVIESPLPLRNAAYELFDYTGKRERSGRLGEVGGSCTISGLENLTSGVYFLKVTNLNGGLSSTRKLIKY